MLELFNGEEMTLVKARAFTQARHEYYMRVSCTMAEADEALKAAMIDADMTLSEIATQYLDEGDAMRDAWHAAGKTIQRLRRRALMSTSDAKEEAKSRLYSLEYQARKARQDIRLAERGTK